MIKMHLPKTQKANLKCQFSIIPAGLSKFYVKSRISTDDSQCHRSNTEKQSGELWTNSQLGRFA